MLATAGCDHRSSDKPSGRDPAPAAGSAAPVPTPTTPPSPATPAANIWHRGGTVEDPLDRTLPAELEPAPAVGAFERAVYLDDAERVVVATSPNGPVIVAAGAGWLRWYRSDGTLLKELDGVGGAHTLLAFDLDKDGSDEIIVGRGRARGALEAKATVEIIYRDGNRERVSIPGSERAELVDVIATGRGLLIGYFDSKYFVTLIDAVRSANGSWRTEARGQVRLATAFTLADLGDGNREALVIGRPYGEALEDEGDAFVLRGEGKTATREVIPTRRGVRGIAAGGDGTVVFSDGWHREYGKRARALLSVAHLDSGIWKSRVAARIAGRTGYHRVELGDLDSDGQAEVVLAGDGPAVIISGWQESGTVSVGYVAGEGAIGDLAAVDVAVGQLDDKPGLELVIAGPGGGIFHKKSR